MWSVNPLLSLMNKNYYLSFLLFCCAVTSGYGQVLTESFNDDSGFTKSHQFYTAGSGNYFGLFDPSGTAHDFDGFPTPPIGVPAYTGNTGFYLVGEDLDGGSDPATQTLTWSGINISGYTGLNLSVDLAADTGGFDVADLIRFEVVIDGGAVTPILTFTGDTTFNGTASNGTYNLSNTFQTVVANIAGTGNTLELRLTISVDSDDEEFAIDEIIIDGTGGCSHSIASISPEEGPAGTEVTITGDGFTDSSTVSFNGTSAVTVIFIDTNTLIAIAPNGATTGFVSVTEASCITNGSIFTYIDQGGS